MIASASTSLRGLANAKLNLFFKVGNKRSDGYHEIQSLIVFLRLADNVTLTLANQEEVEGGGMHLYGINSNNIPKDAQNLAAKATNFLRDNYQGILPKYHVSLAKTIPSGAGLGGGSADAAAVLKLLAGRHQEVQLMVDSYPWHQKLGADVSVCLSNRSSLVAGIGEKICDGRLSESVGKLLHILLVMPKQSLETKAVFDRHADLRGGTNNPVAIVPLIEPLELEDLRRLGNDLLPAAISLCPAIARLIDAMQSLAGCCYACMTGSGSVVFGLFADKAVAYQAYRQMIIDKDAYWVCLTEMLRD